MQEMDCDSLVLGLLTECCPWRMDDIARIVGSAVEAKDSVDRLVLNGLAHRMEGDFIVLSSTGRYAASIRPAQ